MEQYEVIDDIGSGSFGKISRIRRKADGRVLAWKEVNYTKMTEKEKAQLVAEVNILRELRHPNIVRYYERVIDKENCSIYIVMEYCDGGDLTAVIKRLRQERKCMDEETVWRIFTQVVLALHECHRRRGGLILHRDIKPDNIFLDSNQNVKLGDFGLARVLGNKNTMAQTFLGTPYYMSPELVRQEAYNEKSDIWSLGCLLYEMCALSPPFDAPNQTVLNVKIKAGKFSRLPPQYSEELNSLVRCLLDVDPANRPDVEQILSLMPVRMCLRERKLNQHYQALKKKEEQLTEKEQQLIEREQHAAAREAELLRREKELEARLDAMATRRISSHRVYSL